VPDPLAQVYRLDIASGEVGERRRTPHGGLLLKAKLTRTGVFDYAMPDGSVRKELRHPDDVFHPDSVATYAHAVVTLDHPGRVNPSNWKDHAVGHVASAAREGNFMAGEVTLDDAGAIQKAEDGKAQEVSCGYTCGIDPRPGVYDGKPYDVSQKQIRINHVGVGPAGWGRMGPDVRLHLDSAMAVSGAGNGPDLPHYVREHDDANPRGPHGESSMTPEEKAAFDKAQADAAKAQADLEKARADAKDATAAAEKVAAQARADAAELARFRGENEMLRIQVKKETEDSTGAAARALHEKAVEVTIGLRSDARRVFATESDPEGKLWKHDGKTNDAIRREVIKEIAPDMDVDKLDATERKDAQGQKLMNALESVYDMAVQSHKRVDAAQKQLAQTVTAGLRGDGSDDDEPDAPSAREKMIKKKQDAWKLTPKRIDRGRRDRKAAV
jgi:uncharacterized protein